ncbi:MAG: metal ABC transporter ATP-binding protein [Halomonadaceae bacterium]|nr:MAG: metal ABC transporter ATP-binding protein [Halomonadaceae bacterium]
MTDAAVIVTDLSIAYDSKPVLSGLNLNLPANRLITLVGPNGAGKSTLLRVLAGSLTPSTGSVTVLGRTAEAQRKESLIAYMPQQEQIDWDFPLSVWDVVLSGRYGRIRQEGGWRRFLPLSLTPAVHRQAARKALEDTGLMDLRHSAIDTLSGGQRKRVLLARALAQDARLLLLDEPLVGVDQVSENLIMSVLRQARDQGRTVVMVTHDIISARRDADHVVLINRKVVGEGPPGDMLTDDMLSRVATVNWIGERAMSRDSSISGTVRAGNP